MIHGDTITAISTASGMGALAVVRISGDKAFSIAGRIFRPTAKMMLDRREEPPAEQASPAGATRTAEQGNDAAFDMRSHIARSGYVFDPDDGEPIDQVVLTAYKSPKTYTGEDLIEISCHGGRLIPSEVLSLCLKMGARLARAGEFTERAFLNGKIDLTQAEAVLDLIQAKTARQGRYALSALTGSLGTAVAAVRESLLDLMAEVVAGIDFPDEVGEAPAEHVKSVTAHCLTKLEELAATARSGRFLRQGLKLAIVGRPNAGKSSLLNQLLKFERAIVSDTPGTTRDSLEELLDLNGVPVVLVDTAGIRSTEDQIEKAGIERTVRAINECDLAIFVVDLTAGWEWPEQEIERLLAGRPYILTGNKIDAAGDTGRSLMDNSPCAVDKVVISALTGQGLPEFKGKIESWVFAGESQGATYVSLNTRQAELCSKAADALRLVAHTVDSGLPQDCLAVDLKGAVDALSEICGEAVSEEIIGRVFANFCIGK